MRYREALKEEKRRQREARRKRREEGRFLKDGIDASAVPDSPVVFLFPGQGSQEVGMLNESKNVPAVKSMLEKAREILGYDLLQLCIEGRDRFDLCDLESDVVVQGQRRHWKIPLSVSQQCSLQDWQLWRN